MSQFLYDPAKYPNELAPGIPQMRTSAPREWSSFEQQPEDWLQHAGLYGGGGLARPHALADLASMFHNRLRFAETTR
jgi:hypothetical protein